MCLRTDTCASGVRLHADTCARMQDRALGRRVAGHLMVGLILVLDVLSPEAV